VVQEATRQVEELRASGEEDEDEEEAIWDDTVKVLQMLEKEQVCGGDGDGIDGRQ